MIYVIAELRLKPGTSDIAAIASRNVVASTIREDGCLAYDFHVSVTDPTRFVAVERWESREALARHNETPHLLAFRAAIKDIVTEKKLQIISPETVDRQ